MTAAYSMQAGTCPECGEWNTLIGPLHGENGGPTMCIPCGSKIHAQIRREQRRARLSERLFMSSLSSLNGEEEEPAGEDELCREVLEDALRLTHPDRHPPERQRLAIRVTEALLALRPYARPRAKPRDISPVGHPQDPPASVTPLPASSAVLHLPSYPCETCRHTVPDYYCGICRGKWEKIQAADHERDEARRKRENARRRKLRAWRKSKRPNRHCMVCNGLLQSTGRSDSKFCSHACRQRAYRTRVTRKNPGTLGADSCRHSHGAFA